MGSIIFLEPDKLVDNEYSERFRNASIEELIKTFNADVGKAGWVSARGRFHSALAYEFRKRGFRLLNGASPNLDQKVALSNDRMSLMQIADSE